MGHPCGSTHGVPEIDVASWTSYIVSHEYDHCYTIRLGCSCGTSGRARNFIRAAVVHTLNADEFRCSSDVALAHHWAP